MLPQDIEVWEAVDLPAPEKMRYIPAQEIICSCKGLGVTALAGGDDDFCESHGVKGGGTLLRNLGGYLEAT